MKIVVLMLTLLIAACAPQPADFLAVCQAEDAAQPIPPRVAAVLVTEEQQASYRAGSIRICQTYHAGRARLQQQEGRAMVAAIVLGAASDALFVNNLQRDPLNTLAPYRRR